MVRTVQLTHHDMITAINLYLIVKDIKPLPIDSVLVITPDYFEVHDNGQQTTEAEEMPKENQL